MFRKLLSLLSDAAVYGVSSILSQLVGLLLLPILTRYLPPEEYGKVVMLAIISSLFVPLANLGMTNAVFRRYSADKDPEVRARLISTALVSVAVSAMVVLAITLALAAPISRVVLGSAESVGLVRASLVSAAATAVGLVPLIAIRAARRVKTAAAVNVSKVVLSMAVTLWLVVGFELGVWGVVLGTLTSEVATAVMLVGTTLPALRAGFRRDTWRQMVSYGLPFVPHHLQAVGLDLFGLYMVREMLGLSAAALYGVAMRFARPVAFIVNSVQTSWVAYKFQIHAEDSDSKTFFQSTFTYYAAALSYLWVGVSLWGPDAVRLMTAADFHEAAFLVWATALIAVARGLYFMSGTGLELSDNTGPMPLVSFAGLVTVVAAAFTLVGPLGGLGAALATTLGWLMMAAVLYAFSQRRYAISYDWSTIGAFVAMAAGIVVVEEFFVQPLALWLRLTMNVLLSVVYPLACFGLLLRSRDERGRMLLLLSKFRPMPSGR